MFVTHDISVRFWESSQYLISVNMLKKIRNWFLPEIIKSSVPLKTLRDADFFDTIWVKDKNENIYEGWIYDKSRKHIIVTVTNENGELIDYRFIKNGSLSTTELKQDNRILYFNNPCKEET